MYDDIIHVARQIATFSFKATNSIIKYDSKKARRQCAKRGRLFEIRDFTIGVIKFRILMQIDVYS